MKINMKRFLTMMALVGAAASAQAQSNLRFLQNTPISKFKGADTELLTKALNQALDTGEDGVPVTWENSDTGSSGSITPSKDPEGRSNCRKALVKNRHQMLYNATEAVFCKADDKWKLVSQ